MADKKTCDIKGCQNSFNKSSRLRARITKKRDSGEKVAWICPEHGELLEEQIDFRGDSDGD